MDTQAIQAQLAQIKQSIANLEAMTGTLSPGQLQAALAPLRQKKVELESQLSGASKSASAAGSGAVAQGDHATAVGEGGVNVKGNVHGNIITGDGNVTTINYGVSAAGAGDALPPALSPFSKLLVKYFSLSELHTLAFDLGISHDDLPGSTRRQFAEALILYCYRNNKLPELLQNCRAQRSFVAWPQVS